MTQPDRGLLAYPPRTSAFTQRFWDALRENHLSTTRCNDCGRATFPPKMLCPHCWSSRITWIDLSGRGTLRSFTEVWAAPEPFVRDVPYVLGLIDLDEELRLLSRVNEPYAALTPGMRVVLDVVPAEPVSLFAFRLARP